METRRCGVLGPRFRGDDNLLCFHGAARDGGHGAKSAPLPTLRAVPRYRPSPTSVTNTRRTSAWVSRTLCLQRREIRRVAGPRQHPEQIFAGGFRVEFVTDAEPQNLREVMIEPRRRTQDFRGRLRQHAEPGGVVEHMQRETSRMSGCSAA